MEKNFICAISEMFESFWKDSSYLWILVKKRYNDKISFGYNV